MDVKYIVSDKLCKSKLIKEYDFIDLSYANTRLKEINKGIIHKQRKDTLCPCIKTNIQNYGVVVYEKS